MSESTEVQIFDGVSLIAAERTRQISEEGWTARHDSTHDDGALALAGAIYAWPSPRPAFVKEAWPWERTAWKPTPRFSGETNCSCRGLAECNHFGTITEASARAARIRDLVKAGALIAAEIDRLQRVASESGS